MPIYYTHGYATLFAVALIFSGWGAFYLGEKKVPTIQGSAIVYGFLQLLVGLFIYVAFATEETERMLVGLAIILAVTAAAMYLIQWADEGKMGELLYSVSVPITIIIWVLQFCTPVIGAYLLYAWMLLL